MLRRLVPFFSMALICAAPLAAQTVLLVVQESVDGKPLPPPLAAKEGLGSGLFDAGFIVFEFPDSDKAPDRAVVTHTARSTGADLILTVTVQYTETAIDSRLVRRSAHAAYALTNAENGAVRTKGMQDASNKNREADVDQRALGLELGAGVARKVAGALAGAAPAS
ncbi:MAG TPA: hypothetical protein VFB30_01830 [Spirochaetia bacterium]|nr:hypothetical protein [Spirochaetia bacterium]